MSTRQKKIFLISVCHFFDFIMFGEFWGLYLFWQSIGYDPCASKDKKPIAIFSVRLSMIFLVGEYFL